MTTSETQYHIASNNFNSRKEKIETLAHEGKISWVKAIYALRESDKEMANKYPRGWQYNFDKDEFYAYCLQLAERLDRKQISFVYFDAARTQRAGQISARRESLDEQKRQTQVLQKNQELLEQQSEQVRQTGVERNRSMHCTSSVIGGQVVTNCF